MSRVGGGPAMAHSPHYHIQQQRQHDTLRQSPLNSNLPDVAIPSRHSSDEPHHTNIHLSPTSHVSSPKAVHSLSESSTRSSTQSASPTSQRSQHVPLNSSRSPETVQEHRDHRHIGDAGYVVQNTRVQDQMPSHRSSHVQPAEHTIYTYTRDESLDERVESGDHALWILVSRSVREIWLSKSMS